MSSRSLPALVVLQFLAVEGIRQRIDLGRRSPAPKLPEVPLVPLPEITMPPGLVQSRPKSSQCGIYVGDAGKTFGGESHSVVMALDFTDSKESAHKRQWILNIGQQGPGAEHWLYTPATGAIQFGTWGPFAGGGQISGVDISKTKHTLATVYDEPSKTYSLYIDGELAKTHSNMIFDMQSSDLAAGDKQQYHPDANFNGCISGVDVYPYALTPTLVQAASIKLAVESLPRPLVESRPKSSQCGIYVGDAGKALGGASHSVVMALDFTDSKESAHKRQWILNIGQQGPGAEHWLYTPATGAIQFGTWLPFAGGGQISGVDISKTKHTLATVYDEPSKTYSLYIDGKLAKTHSNMHFDIKTSALAAGDKQRFHADANFNGCISGVDIYSSALTAKQMVAAAAKLQLAPSLQLANSPVKDGLIVSGAGYADANGLYLLDGNLNGKKKWINGNGCNIVWFSNWGWGIGCHGHHRYYASTCDGEDPTACNAKLIVRTVTWAGKAPVPTIAHAPPPVKDGLIVSGAGYADANGVYAPHGISQGKKQWIDDKKSCVVAWHPGWGWGIGCQGHHRYYAPTCDEEDPTACNEDLLVRETDKTDPAEWAGQTPVPSIGHA